MNEIKTTERRPLLQRLKDEYESGIHGASKPRIRCPECNGELQVRWGANKPQPYVVHLVKLIDTCTFQKIKSETFEHKYAKYILCNFLNSGGTMIVTEGCMEHEQMRFMRAGDSKVEVEMTIGDQRLDIGWKSNQVGMTAAHGVCETEIYCVEILHTSKTRELNRRGMIWIEVTAWEVLDQFISQPAPPTSINLTNMRSCQDCRGGIEYQLEAIGLNNHIPITTQLSGKRKMGFTREGFELAVQAKFIIFKRTKYDGGYLLGKKRGKAKGVKFKVYWVGHHELACLGSENGGLVSLPLSENGGLDEEVKLKLDAHGRCLECGVLQDRKISDYPLCDTCVANKSHPRPIAKGKGKS